jgi:hypothetical protein
MRWCEGAAETGRCATRKGQLRQLTEWVTRLVRYRPPVNLLKGPPSV